MGGAVSLHWLRIVTAALWAGCAGVDKSTGRPNFVVILVNAFGVDLQNIPPFSYVENARVAPLPAARCEHDPSHGTVLPRGFAGSLMALR